MIKPSQSIPRHKIVAFCLELDVQIFEISPRPPNSRPRRSRLKIEKVIYEKYGRGYITKKMLEEAAVLFNENYNIWAKREKGKLGGKLGKSH